MDYVMETISGTLMWLPLYLFILAFVWYKFGWQRALAFVVCLALAIGFSDIICGIFKHSGPLKHLWESFPVRHRPMFDSAVRDLAHVPSYKHGAYGTVSAHAATTVALAWFSALTIRKKWYNWVIGVSVVLIELIHLEIGEHLLPRPNTAPRRYVLRDIPKHVKRRLCVDFS